MHQSLATKMDATLQHAPSLIDGVSVIDATPPGRPLEASFEVCLQPEAVDVQPTLSGVSACSSLCAETGAPEIRHLETPPTVEEEEENENGVNELKDPVVGADEEERADDDTSPCPSAPVQIVQPNSFESAASSLTMREGDFSVPLGACDFGLCLMPEETTPRAVPRVGATPVVIARRRDMQRDLRVVPRVSARRGQRPRDLRVAAPAHSRYRRPVDSLLATTASDRRLRISPPTPSAYQRPADTLLVPTGKAAEARFQKPSPVAKHGSIRHRRQNDAPLRLAALAPASPRTPNNPLTPSKRTQPEGRCENVNPQSPTARMHRKKVALTPKNALTAREVREGVAF